MKITYLATCPDGRVLYKAQWGKETNYVCVSRAFFEKRMKEKEWDYV